MNNLDVMSRFFYCIDSGVIGGCVLGKINLLSSIQDVLRILGLFNGEIGETIDDIILAITSTDLDF
jgi:hypothetical protein